MTVKFKSERRNYVYDTVSGRIIPLSRVGSEIFSQLSIPMPRVCPTSLRYELARYDSQVLSEEYSLLYALYEDKSILSEDGEEGVIYLRHDPTVSAETVKNAVKAIADVKDKERAYTLRAEIYPDEARAAALESGLTLNS